MPHQFKQDHILYVTSNWRNESDEVMAEKLGLKPLYVAKIRGYHKLSRYKNAERTPVNDVAKMIEMFANGSTVVAICRKFNVGNRTVNTLIQTHYYRLPRSYNTVTLVLESKLNYS